MKKTFRRPGRPQLSALALLVVPIACLMVAAACGNAENPAPANAVPEVGAEAATAETRKLRVAFNEFGNPPMYFPHDDSRLGIHKEILLAIGRIAGFEFEFSSLPIKRLRAMFDEGELDLEIGTNPKWFTDPDKAGLFSRQYAESVDIVLFAAGKRRPVKGPDDLRGARVAVIGGYRYPVFDEAFAAASISREDCTSELAILELLALGRVEVAILSRYTALFWMAERADFSALEPGDAVGRLPVHVRVNPRRPELLAAIDAAIEALLASGEIERIYAKYAPAK